MKNKKGGYIALISVLIVSVALISIMTSISINSIYILNEINDDHRSVDARHILDSCAEEVMMKLNLENALPASVLIIDKTCSVQLNNKTSDTWDFTVQYNTGEFVYSVIINATRTTNLNLNSWTYIE